MSFKKTGEIKVYRKDKEGISKKAGKESPARYTVDDLVDESEAGYDPYEEEDWDLEISPKEQAES